MRPINGVSSHSTENPTNSDVLLEGVELFIPCEKLRIRFSNARVHETAGFRLPYVFRVLRKEDSRKGIPESPWVSTIF